VKGTKSRKVSERRFLSFLIRRINKVMGRPWHLRMYASSPHISVNLLFNLLTIVLFPRIDSDDKLIFHPIQLSSIDTGTGMYVPNWTVARNGVVGYSKLEGTMYSIYLLGIFREKRWLGPGIRRIGTAVAKQAFGRKNTKIRRPQEPRLGYSEESRKEPCLPIVMLFEIQNSSAGKIPAWKFRYRYLCMYVSQSSVR